MYSLEDSCEMTLVHSITIDKHARQNGATGVPARPLRAMGDRVHQKRNLALSCRERMPPTEITRP